ncbi:hypothetical protein RND81_02G036700 [Saponaria officinalis]|uniref:Uncharacterized protein n=1 Tax=Saponaria officinalis TaxID=3572 RepID=A0AAW1MJP1_SAPOF
MACISAIERLHPDEMREIMVRVAAQPNGAAHFTRACAVSKSFRNFMEDSDVLRKVSFGDLFSRLEGRYELFSEVGGLVARCARAGNLDAQLMLAKVLIVSAATLCNAKMEAKHSDVSQDQYSTLCTGNTDLIDLDKATRILDEFSAQNTDAKELLDLVKNFLSEAKLRDFVEIQDYLKGFVALYLVPKEECPCEIFLDTFDRLCERNSRLLGVTSDSSTFFANIFSDLCKTGLTTMKVVGIDKEVYRPLLECSVRMNADDVGYETMMVHLDIVEPILKLGSRAAATQGCYELVAVKNDVLRIAAMLRQYLTLIMDHEVFVLCARESLLSSFCDLFDI